MYLFLKNGNRTLTKTELMVECEKHLQSLPKRIYYMYSFLDGCGYLNTFHAFKQSSVDLPHFGVKKHTAEIKCG